MFKFNLASILYIHYLYVAWIGLYMTLELLLVVIHHPEFSLNSHLPLGPHLAQNYCDPRKHCQTDPSACCYEKCRFQIILSGGVVGFYWAQYCYGLTETTPTQRLLVHKRCNIYTMVSSNNAQRLIFRYHAVLTPSRLCQAKESGRGWI